MRALLLVAGFLVVAPSAAAGQASAPDGIIGADIVVRDGGRLQSAVLDVFRADQGVVWVGYDVPRNPDEGHVCCYRDGDLRCCAGCTLEGDDWFAGRARAAASSAQELEVEPRLRIFLRIDGGHLTRLRTFSDDCPVDAEGTRLIWLDGVDPAASLALMSDLVSNSGPVARRVRARGDHDGAHAAMMAVSLHRGSASLNLLLDWARHAQEKETRRQALFWLSQRAGVRAAATIENAVLNDPDEEVKAQAVFAVGQLPPDRGIPLLIRFARTHPIPKVRRQAIFWLGQMDDERALDFIEELLELG